MKPKKVEFEVGQSVYGNRILFIWERDYMGREGWMISRLAKDQRDDDQAVYGLPDDVILAMAEAVKSRR